jgi:HAD superfamily hydrolase (TIGR01509 family)
MIQACLFDMGNVLVFFSHVLMCEQIARVCGSSIDNVRSVLFDSKWQHAIESGEISEAEFHRRMEQHLGRQIDAAALLQAACDIFTPNQEIIPVLKSLKQQGQRLVLLSNTCLSHLEFVRRQSNILQDFDALVLSYEVGSMKPAPAIYQAAIAKAGCDAGHCFYTDDIEENISAGRAHGLQAEIYTTVTELRSQLQERGIDTR